MARLTRAQTQQRNRTRVLAAARDEFLRHGFRDATVDGIAERAELTRGAVYSNFAGKRALYFAVLADDAATAARAAPTPAGAEAGDAADDPASTLGRIARAWMARAPLAGDPPDAHARIGADLMAEVRADDRLRTAYAQLIELEAIVVGLALEAGAPAAGRRVRVARTALTLLHGANQLAAAAPGFVEPFDVVRACERLAGLDGRDIWQPAHLPHVPPARPAHEHWSPPAGTDLLTGRPARLEDDGVVAVLGVHRLGAIEEAIRAAPSGCAVTAVIVTAAPGELMPLAELVVTEARGLLCHAVGPDARPALRVVADPDGTVAAAAGVTVVDDATEAAVRVESRRVVARAFGRGAGHAAATTLG